MFDGVEDPEGRYRAEVKVTGNVIDENGHVNNVVYVQWMQDIAIAHSKSSGGTAAMDKAGGTWVVRSHRIEYLKPVFAGETIDVSTWIAEIGGVRSLRRYEFRRVPDGQILARGETDWVFLDGESGKPRAIPSSVRSCFRVLKSAVSPGG